MRSPLTHSQLYLIWTWAQATIWRWYGRPRFSCPENTLSSVVEAETLPFTPVSSPAIETWKSHLALSEVVTELTSLLRSMSKTWSILCPSNRRVHLCRSNSYHAMVTRLPHFSIVSLLCQTTTKMQWLCSPLIASWITWVKTATSWPHHYTIFQIHRHQ